MNQMDDLMQKPVAWMHVMDNTEGLKANDTGIVSITQKRKQPFGKPGVDFSKSYPVTSTPLYTEDQLREYAKKAVEAERAACAKLAEEDGWCVTASVIRNRSNT